ncbi:2-haloacid dehalogenase [Catalinimonas alkaloidigena]|uniref:haloacid dehalogenase type II n=1 Tax=Catalinimonas alkaloidigena TaxID=1075417 RepID=UPI002406DFB5|nr:haloacid dehalogenase type II [Catalinimonas alkaloidigena]MDF9800459.1 2-haloacid dehalogenase [Catalinimonas alkaloidigena]
MQARPAVLFFDVNETLLDMQPVKTSIAQALGQKPERVALWFTNLLHYSLVSTVSHQFKDFTSIGVATLQMLAEQNNIEMSEAKAREVLKPMLSLSPHADVVQGLETLKSAGYTMVALTNSSRHAMETQLSHAQIDTYFDRSLSVEDIGIYKPHQRVYRWAAYQMDSQVEDCMMIAAHGWDVAGASYAGMQSAFIARPGQTLFPLALQPQFVVSDLKELAEVL